MACCMWLIANPVTVNVSMSCDVSVCECGRIWQIHVPRHVYLWHVFNELATGNWQPATCVAYYLHNLMYLNAILCETPTHAPATIPLRSAHLHRDKGSLPTPVH